MAFKYRGGDRKVEDVVRRSKQAGGSYDSWLSSDASFLKIKEGDNTIRIMPPTWDDKEKWGTGWEVQVYLHRNVGPDNGTYLCLDKMLGKTCPVCEARREATDEDEADALKPNWRGIAWVIDRNNEKAGPQIMSLPITLFREINTRSIRKKDGELLLIDGDKECYGHDVMFSREGSDKKTKYVQVEIDQEATPLCDSEKKEKQWLDFIEENPLPEMLNFYDAEHIEKVLFGKTERRKKRGDDDEEETTRPSRRSRRGESEEETEAPRRRGRREEAVDDPEEETERPRRRRSEPEEETEVEERPRRRGRAEPEEDTEEEAPRRRGRREEPDEEEAPRSRRRAAEPEEETEAEERPRRRGRAEPEEEAEEPSGGKVARRRGGRDAEPEEETEAPRRRGRAEPEEEDNPVRGRLKRLRERAS